MPKQGGTLIASQIGDINITTGFPYILIPGNAFMHYFPLETVIEYRDSLTPELVLATRFEFNDDYTGLVVDIDPNIDFHNGGSLTAEDFTFGLELMKDPAAYGISGAFQLGPFVNAIASTSINGNTVEFEFDQPRGNMADLFAQMPVVQRSSYAKIQSGEAVNGTGPYRFHEWKPGQSIAFSSFANWHRASATDGPFLDGIEVRLFADNDSMGLAYRDGEIDLVVGAPPALAAEYRDRMFLTHKAGLQYVGMNLKHSDLGDVRVRQAVFQAVDRERIVTEVWEGLGDITLQPWPSTSPAFEPELEQAMYDPENARNLLAEAGWSQRDAIPLDHRTGATDVAMAAVVQQSLKDVGIEIVLKPHDSPSFQALLRGEGFEGMWIANSAFANLAPLTNFQQTFPFRIPNPSNYESPIYLDIRKKLETLDPVGDGAAQEYKRFNEVWVEDPWMVPLAPFVNPHLVSPRLRNYGQFLVAPTNVPVAGSLWLE
jgi:peptide/nickel transport system substrate-binding protein